ncbi:MAG: tRNA pseudouridine(38-40) synthase TruA [Bacillota bacterium]
MRNIKLVLEYDGTAYHGWQSQVNAITVQDVLTSAINRLTGEKCSVTGSSRTDTGVHALAFVCNFFTASSIPADKFAFALNTLLPEDIVVKSSQEVPPDFHSQFSAKGKKYIYLVYNSAFPPALLRRRAYHVYYPLNINAMREAAGHFLGTHNFSAFSASGGPRKTMVRTITEAEVDIMEPFGKFPVSSCPEGMLIGFSVTGSGFLYNMVRIMAGTLVEVGFGKLKPGDIPEIIASRDRRKAGRTAPAHGLYLAGVYYDGA